MKQQKNKANVFIIIVIFLLTAGVAVMGFQSFALTQKINNLNSKISNIETNNSEALAKAGQAESEISTLKSEIETLNASINKTNDELSNIKTQTTALETSANNIKTQIVQNIPAGADPSDYDEKTCYLTFDDGPSSNTPKILEILRNNNAKATFFVIGLNDKYDHYMKDIVDEGHAIALHSYTHEYYSYNTSIYRSEKAFFDELDKIHAKVLKLTGVDTKLFRFPGGSSNTISKYSPGIMTRLTKQVEERGFVYFDWNVDSRDASGNGVASSTLVNSVMTSTGSLKSVNVLMHDTDAKSTTVSALPEIIAFYKSKGYDFDKLTTSSPPCHQAVNN